MDIYRVFHPSSSEYTFFSVAHGSLSKIDHMLFQKEVISRDKKLEILPCIQSGHNRMQLERSNKITNKIYSHSWRLSSMLLNDAMITRYQGRNKFT